MVVYPHAKINIGLRVVARRSDGFHDIETVFYPISLSDRLEIELSDAGAGLDFECSGSGLINEHSGTNLCCKAYDLLNEACGLPPVKMRLHKQIPVGAGLGGGSSDAAFTLLALNRLCGLALSDNELNRFAARLGSDCAFFIRSVPAIGMGKGDVLQEIPLSLDGYSLLVVKPPVSVSTAEAYSRVQPLVRNIHLTELLQLPVNEWKQHITNDFEKFVFAQYPEIEQIKNKLYDLGAIYATMSGSGSSVYGIFECLLEHPENIFQNNFVWQTKKFFSQKRK
ncbi:MAG: 4-(cytidine 5'-diphospho)-2-C-methyl-D-erythritol kinase [Bacteroidales bacterium]|jgi:4-diphosphocytidyl-2-C-methyl-D-erythritol kinase|nr:4-(cytidine 5'-diphospho)-2-C-methyl-D-erythritol kinase [Bacteroidales bacterium]